MITANVTLMFQGSEPWDCSNSRANLGDQAGRLTWESATQAVGEDAPWLMCPLPDACEEMRRWCKESGGWDREEIAAMSDADLLGIFVQNIAADLRMLGSDDNDELSECVQVQDETDWESESEYPTGSYYIDGDTGHVCVQWSYM